MYVACTHCRVHSSHSVALSIHRFPSFATNPSTIDFLPAPAVTSPFLLSYIFFSFLVFSLLFFIKFKFHGNSLLVACSWHPREDGARVEHVDEDVTRMLRGNCSRGIPAILARYSRHADFLSVFERTTSILQRVVSIRASYRVVNTAACWPAKPAIVLTGKIWPQATNFMLF